MSDRIGRHADSSDDIDSDVSRDEDTDGEEPMQKRLRLFVSPNSSDRKEHGDSESDNKVDRDIEQLDNVLDVEMPNREIANEQRLNLAANKENLQVHAYDYIVPLFLTSFETIPGVAQVCEERP